MGKKCAGCGTDISHKYANAKWCTPECRNRSLTPEQRRKYRLTSKYKITPEDYDAMVAKQGGRCAICLTDDPKTKHGFWHIDHCHNSLKVRGLLCSTCNTGLGSFYDDFNHLVRAAMYVGGYLDE